MCTLRKALLTLQAKALLTDGIETLKNAFERYFLHISSLSNAFASVVVFKLGPRGD